MKEIGAWVDAFEQLGRAGRHAVAALEENNTRDAVTQLVQATEPWRPWMAFPPPQPGRPVCRSVVKTGSRVMTPAVNELADTVPKKFSPLLRALRPFPPSPGQGGQYGQGGTLL
ncbi:MAG: hypothetical protein ACLT8E_12585 [Akkermansia sp.]